MTSTDPDAEQQPRRWWKRLTGTRIDITPLRTSRDFRILWVSGAISYLGLMFGFVAVPYQLYLLTSSSLAVGAMGAVQLVPLIIFGLYGGALSDRLDRRTIQLVTGAAQVLLVGVLLINSLLPDPQVWVLYVVGAFTAIASALQRPSREALLPRVVRHHEIPAAVAISSLAFQIGMLVGPGIGGLVISRWGPPVAYTVELIGIGLATVLLIRLRRYPPTEEPTEGHIASIGAGLRYATRRKDLLGTYVVDMVGMFMAMPVVLFPAFALEVLGRPEMLGLLYTAEAVGSMIATLTSGWTRRIHRHGRAVTLAAICWGAAIGMAGLAPNIWVALVFLTLAGGFDMVSGIFRAVIWNQTIPDSMRGRLAAIEMLSYSIGPLGGQLRSGLVADLTTVRISIVSGGILCVAGVTAVSAGLRDFWRYDSRTDEHAVAERAARAAREGGPDTALTADGVTPDRE